MVLRFKFTTGNYRHENILVTITHNLTCVNKNFKIWSSTYIKSSGLLKSKSSKLKYLKYLTLKYRKYHASLLWMVKKAAESFNGLSVYFETQYTGTFWQESSYQKTRNLIYLLQRCKQKKSPWRRIHFQIVVVS